MSAARGRCTLGSRLPPLRDPLSGAAPGRLLRLSVVGLVCLVGAIGEVCFPLLEECFESLLSSLVLVPFMNLLSAGGVVGDALARTFIVVARRHLVALWATEIQLMCCVYPADFNLRGSRRGLINSLISCTGRIAR